VGTTTVTWTVKDSTLAKATATQMVTITAKTTGTAILSFVVTDSKGNPVRGAKVEVSAKGIEIEKMTDYSGKATITVVLGNYKYEVEKQGYSEIEGNLYVTGSKSVPVKLVSKESSRTDD
jgi:Rieske Fe-S protein